MLKAFVDDSGSANDQHQRYFVLAGYVLPVLHWETFADEWSAELKNAPRITAFKMYNADHGGGYFEGMAAEFRKCKVNDLAQLIHRFDPMGMACHIRWVDYQSIVAGKVHKKLDNPYAILFYQIMRLIHEWQIDGKAKRPEREYQRVDFVFDDQADKGFKALQWYGPLKANMREPYSKMLGATPIFESDEDMVPLQAADLLAWHVRRKLEHPDQDLPVFEIAARHYAELEIGAEELTDYVGLCKRVDPTTLVD
jgi:Protein of unknown function (DUF3800)